MLIVPGSCPQRGFKLKSFILGVMRSDQMAVSGC
jgi:hypothetical protein